jgi:transcription antitermination factor NusG
MHLTEMEMEIQCANGTPNWYALFTRHQFEKSVAFSLSNKNHEVYLPLYRSVRQWQDRSKQLWSPLFPSYLFIKEGMDRQLEILTTPGVLQIVSWGGHPAIVPQAQLDAVRQILESCLIVETHPYLRCGDRVRVKTGPLMGLEGILVRSKGLSRLVISMEMLGRSAAVEIDVLNVERVGPMQSPRAADRLSVSA